MANFGVKVGVRISKKNPPTSNIGVKPGVKAGVKTKFSHSLYKKMIKNAFILNMIQNMIKNSIKFRTRLAPALDQGSYYQCFYFDLMFPTYFSLYNIILYSPVVIHI